MDCVVEIRRPIDGRFQEIPEPLRAEIKQQVSALNLGDHKGRLLFDVSSTTAGRELIDTVFDSREPPRVPPNVTDPAIIKFILDQGANYQPSPAMKLANDLGFDSIRCRHTPGGGAPEKLIGQPAPNFTLPRLEGDELQLSAFISDRPALVTFWGVACGPCCVEAPHLSKLHGKYGTDFGIVAVNGYNESREVVAKFVDKTMLHHPIVLNGRSVADDLYQVGSYPTTFWINREGIVEDYEVGFDSAAELERRIVKMLKTE
jgi:thiol-disulfide isomerase/thioredoxin